MNIVFKVIVISIICLGLCTNVMSQADTSGLWVNFDSIYISSTRIEKSWLNAPQAISQKTNKIESSLEQDLSPIRLFDNIPGVFIMNSNNYAQDLRLSVRGFGSRSSFGIRGLKVIVDGIPQSTPDGQTQLDDLPIGFVRSLEVLRGSASSLYGNASGGVISLKTINPSNTNLTKPFFAASSTFGSFNSLGVQLMGAIAKNNSSYTFFGSHNSSDGFREHSAFTNRVLKGGFTHDFSKYAKIKINLQYLNSPKAEDSGALSLSQVASSRAQARPRNLNYNTGEAVNQIRSSVKYSYQASRKSLFELYGFYTNRKFENYLPFQIQGNINLNRKFYGQGTSYKLTRKKRGNIIEFKYGYDIAIQKDKRASYSNLDGIRGPLDEDLDASFKNVGLYIINHTKIDRLTLNAGLRFDNHEIRIRDNFLLNNDISGGVDYSVWNPSLGLSYSLNENTAVYANYSTSFETPTLNELTNNPLALEGPNTFLEPQEAKNIELGLKMKDTDKLKLDINLFNVRTSNDLVPYELTNFPGKTFFRNIGSSNRTGLELNAYYSILQNLNADLTYTLSSFNYDSYAVNDLSFDGNVLPGVPSHVASLQLNYQHDLGLSMSLYNQYVGLIYVADDNLESTPSYLMSNFRISYEHQLSNFRVVPFLGVNNLLNTEYNDNIRINAFLNSYYEPAPGRNYFGGLKVLF